MNTESKLDIFCIVDDQRTTGFVIRRPLTRTERISRSAKIFGVFLIIAVLTIFIPILHFVLPPLSLLVGGVFATTTWLETSEIISGEIPCPNCQKPFIFQREAEEWPKKQRCAGCSFLLSIQPQVQKI